jgi:homoserine O-acetyltransferase/O-succinyltransferase
MSNEFPTAQGVFSLGDWTLQSGAVLRDARLSWRSFGTLSPRRDNVIVYPTSFAAQHGDIQWLVGADGILDATRWFIVIPDMFGNGLSSSPSNDPAYPALVSAGDNVAAQRHCLREAFGIEHVACVYGWSMGAQQAYHWAALFPDEVERAIVCCGSARTAPHNRVFLAGLRAILEAAPEYAGEGRFRAKPEAALRAFGRVYAGWALSQEFYREGLHRTAFGAADLEAFLAANWNGRFAVRDAANLMAHLRTWDAADISAGPVYGGDLPAALRAIRARVLLMPGATDLYFRVADNEVELQHLRDAELVAIPSIWGHLAGNPQRNPQDAAFLREQVARWLAR